MLIYSMKPGHDGSVALIDTDTQDLRQRSKKICKTRVKNRVGKKIENTDYN